ncbi:MAG TPA: hypothetical protein VKZ79_13355 [Alphaproteobacteria bacterium]|nr:hypothetical protein [Alphaproteobacteria bacterium]
MSNFAFLAAEFPAVHGAAVEAERQAGVSPTAALGQWRDFEARKAASRRK